MCIIQVNVPIEMAPHLSERMVGGQDGGAIPRLLFMEIPTPKATRIRPRVDMLYLLRMSDFITGTKVRKKTDKEAVEAKCLRYSVL